MERDIQYTEASPEELNELLAGRLSAYVNSWNPGSRHAPLPPEYTGVLLRRMPDSPDFVQPFALIAREQDLRKLCARFAQVRSDFSPLSSWCHLLTPRHFQVLDSFDRMPDLGGVTAAWSGLAVAEALLLSEKPITNLRISACIATQSFALARTRSLWVESESEIATRFELANGLFRTSGSPRHPESRHSRVRKSLKPIWDVLSELSTGDLGRGEAFLRPIADSLRYYLDARTGNSPRSNERFIEPLIHEVAEARDFSELSEAGPERRVLLFDKLILSLRRAQDEGNSIRRVALAFLAGYLSTVAAGGAPSISLAEAVAQDFPEVLAWAFAIGSLGERVVWTSGFDGLGRLVARELNRPFRIDEPPICDIALEEAAFLVDAKLSDPLVHLRIKQARTATIAIFPGSNILVSVGDPVAQDRQRHELAKGPRQGSAPQQTSSRDLGRAISDLVWPYLEDRIGDYLDSFLGYGDQGISSGKRPGRTKKKGSPQTRLPLQNPRE